MKKTENFKDAYFTDEIDESELAQIIQYVDRATPSRRDTKTTKNGVKRNKVKKFNNYIVQEMFNREKFIGRIFLYQPRKTIDSSILELFLNQVGGYLENLELQQKLEEVAQTDGLTGVFNRYYFDKRFAEEKELSLKFGQPLSLILVDVNGLKELNDVVGHEAGDTLLSETATLINANIRDSDSIYRIGGDEYIIMLSNCTTDQLEKTMTRLKEIQRSSTFQLNGETYNIRFSLGGACSEEIPHEQLKDESDKRMYVDKENYYKTHKKYR